MPVRATSSGKKAGKEAPAKSEATATAKSVAPATSISEAKAALPQHEYITAESSPFPVHRIFDSECEVTYSKIHPINMVMRLIYTLVGLGVWSAIVIIAALVLGIAVPVWFSVLAGFLLAFPWVVGELIETAFILKTYRFSLQPEYLFVRMGALSPTYHILAYENIQDAQISQGPVQRILGICSVVVSTPANIVAVPDLKLDVGQKFRDELLTLARLHRGMAE